MIVAGTGHRPEDCEGEGVVRIKARVALQYNDVDTFICGMASGFDLWAGDEARKLGIPVWAVRPWAGHKPHKGDEQLYAEILGYASKTVIIDESSRYPGVHVYPMRNHWMVDHATHLMCYWNGKTSGGTYECRNYAKEVGRPVKNIYYDPPF